MGVGTGGSYFASRDGIRVTQGGPSTYLSDQIRPIFNGIAANGYQPIDVSQRNAWRLEVHNNDLWFLYLDSNGTRQCLIYSLLYSYWRAQTFAEPPRLGWREPTPHTFLLLVLSTH